MSDRNDDPIAMFEAAARRKRLIGRILVGMGALAFLLMIGKCVMNAMPRGPSGVSAPAEVRAEVQAAVDQALAAARSDDAAFRTGIAAAVASATPSSEPCPIALRSRSTDPSGYQPASFPLRRVQAGEPLPGSLRLEYVQAAAGGVDGHMKDRYDTAAIARERVLAWADELRTADPIEVLLVVDREIGPFADIAGVGYSGGTRDGRAYLWDYRAGEVVCVGAVHVTSSEAISFDSQAGQEHYAAQAKLDADFEIRTEQAVAASMFAIAR